MNIYTFIITSFIIIITPGTGVIYTISVGLMKGKKTGMIAALGCTAGILPHLLVSIALSSVLQQMSELAFFVLKSAGAFYLFYLGIGMILTKTRLDFSKTITIEKPSAIILKAILINVLNPKLTLFFFSFLPQYVNSGSQDYVKESIWLGIVFMAVTFFVFSLYGFLAGYMKALLHDSSKMIQRIQKTFGLIFIAFAVNLIGSSI